MYTGHVCAQCQMPACSATSEIAVILRDWDACLSLRRVLQNFLVALENSQASFLETVMRASRKNHLSDRHIALFDPDALLGLTKGGIDELSSPFLI